MTKLQQNIELYTDGITEPALELYNNSQDEYIRSLEMSVQLLQREVANLRSKKSTVAGRKSSGKSIQLSSGIKNINQRFQSCSTDIDVLTLLQEQLSLKYSIVESNIYFFSPDKSLQPVSGSENSASFESQVNRYEEEGVIDWATEKGIASIIPSLQPEPGEKPLFFIVMPFFLRGTAMGIFAASTTRDNSEFDKKELNDLKIIAESAASALDNIRSSGQISSMNRRLAALNQQMLQSTRFASIGELAASFALEIDNPLKIIAGNINLIESGVGDASRRLEIIKEQVDKINDINKRLSNLAFNNKSEAVPSNLNLASLIDEVLLFSGFQFQRDGIKVEKEFEDINMSILGMKPQIEHVILNMMLFARDSMPEGGLLTIGLFRTKTNRAVISITDTGTGIGEEDVRHLFEPAVQPDNNKKGYSANLFVIKNIIQQHKGTITAISDLGRGTTFKIQLPVIVEK